MGHYFAIAGGQLKNEIEAKRAAKEAPLLKALKGDRLRIFKVEFAGQDSLCEAYVSGGTALATSEYLSAAIVWYTYGNSHGIVDTWHITGWKFDADKLTGKVSRSGFGLKPAAASYR